MVNAGLTISGKEIVPVELAGQHASYQALKPPKRPAYPRGDEARYSDDYLARINKLYSIDELLDTQKEGIVAGDWGVLYSLTMGSPLAGREQNHTGEEILRAILYNSAQVGLWQPKIIDVSALTGTQIKSAEEYLKAVLEIPSRRKERLMDCKDIEVLLGVNNAQSGRFVIPTKLENKVIVLPSQEFIEYIARQK